MRGPAPKPTKIIKLQGNPGKRKINKNEPNPEILENIKCPSYLDKFAKKEWKRIVPELQKLGLLTTVDVAAIEGYCIAYSQMKNAAQFIKKNGSTFQTKTGYRQQVPEVGILNKSLKIIKDFCHEFGLTPSARSRMTIPEMKDNDPMEEYLARKN